MEAPLLRVSRPISACSRCRSAKIKCDGALPACSACQKSNRKAECSNANDQLASRERSYVASLESRVEKLKQKIIDTKGAMGSPSALNSEFAPLDIPHSQTNDMSTSKEKRQHRENSDVDDLVSDFGFLSVNATARDFHGFTQEMSFAKLVLSAALKKEMPRFMSNTLPSRHESIKLVQYYIDNVSILYPVMTETNIFGSMEAVYQLKLEKARPIDYWNIRMVLAIALAAQSNIRDDLCSQDAVRHASAALKYAESVIRPGSVSGVEAILLLVIYSFFDAIHFSSWYLIGTASRAMVDLGLHQDPSEESRLTPHLLASRRRVYQCVYTLDRSVSIAHFRTFSFSDDSTNINLPIDVDYSPSSSEPVMRPTNLKLSSLGPASYLMQTYKMQSVWYQASFHCNAGASRAPWQSRCEALNRMQQWLEAVPPSNAASVHKLHSEVLHCSLLFIWPPTFHVEVDQYGRALTYDYATGYIKHTWVLCTSPSFAFCTSLDLTRASYIAQRFIEILDGNTIASFMSHPRLLPPFPQNPSSKPPLLTRYLDADLQKVVHFLDQMTQILQVLGQKFGDLSSHDAFQKSSADLLESAQW